MSEHPNISVAVTARHRQDERCAAEISRQARNQPVTAHIGRLARILADDPLGTPHLAEFHIGMLPGQFLREVNASRPAAIIQRHTAF